MIIKKRMKISHYMYTIAASIISSYSGRKLERLIKKYLKDEQMPLRGGSADNVSYWMRLLERHVGNFPYVVALISRTGATATIIFNEQLFELLSTTTYSSIYLIFAKNKIPSGNKYIEGLMHVQTANKFARAHDLMQAYELKPKMSKKEKLKGYKLIVLELLNFDTKLKAFYSLIRLSALLAYLFTGNLFIFVNMLGAIISLIQESKISRALGKFLIKLLKQRGILVSIELEDIA